MRDITRCARAMGIARETLPSLSDFHLLCHRDSVVDFDAQIPDCALDFSVYQKQLNRAQVTRPLVD
jgi:hypothetical protein